MLPAPVLAAMLMWFVKREFSRFEVTIAKIEHIVAKQSEFITKPEHTNAINRCMDEVAKEREIARGLIADLRERVRVLESKQ